MNFINSYKSTNKTEKYEVSIRLGTMTLLQIRLCLCTAKKCSKFRFMLLNLGFEF